MAGFEVTAYGRFWVTAEAQQDIAEDPPAHALIVGLPLMDENPKLAEDLATELVKLSRSVDRQRRP